LSIDKGIAIQALKNVTINEPFFVGHFPHRPVMPGVLMLEALAQVSAILALDAMNQTVTKDTLVYFVGIDNARFKRPVEPGDQLTLNSKIERCKAGIYKFSCSAYVGQDIAAQADLMCTMRSVP
jgi:3-hydroxyacyl-[acyl-carrier-protein] dehydratase